MSLWLSPGETVQRALAAMRGNHLVVMPLGPQHLLTLSPTTLPMLGERGGGLLVLVRSGSACPYDACAI